MVRLAGGVELFDPMPVDRLHHAHLSGHHRAVVLRSLKLVSGHSQLTKILFEMVRLFLI
jgi:hypothetical protein